MKDKFQKFILKSKVWWQFCLHCLDQYTRSKYATYILFIVAFTESAFFVIPPDALLIPMAFVRPNKAFFYALITTIGSVLGGAFGYVLGYFVFDSIGQHIINYFGYQDKFLYFENLYNHYGVVITFIAGFSPIPYKIATLSAGFVKANFVSFIVVSIISRGLRFFLLAILIKYYHNKGKNIITKYFSTIVIIISVTILIICLIYFFVKV
ncbi:cytochrome B [Candidatus Hepatincola sp. Pdp]